MSDQEPDRTPYPSWMRITAVVLIVALVLFYGLNFLF